MKKVLDKALALWKWVWKGYDPKETSLILLGGAIVKALDGELLATLTFALFAGAIQLPKFIKWLKNELLTEEERADIESDAHSIGLELEGKVFLTFSDESGKVVLKDQLDSKLVLNAIIAAMSDTLRRQDDQST